MTERNKVEMVLFEFCVLDFCTLLFKSVLFLIFSHKNVSILWNSKCKYKNQTVTFKISQKYIFAFLK